MQRNMTSSQISESAELSILTYNVWTNNSESNIDSLCGYLSVCNADIICLQEVTQRFYDKLTMNHSELLEKYDFLNPPAADFWDMIACDGELILTKKKFNATLFKPVSLEGTNQNRYFSYGKFEINGVSVGFATAHIESVFYKDIYTELKAKQLRQICKALDEMQVDAYILCGDINFTGGDQLQAENNCVDKLDLVDVWKELNGASDDVTDQKFRDKDATWDGLHNENIADKTEFQRPDRVYVRFFKRNIEPVAIARIETNWSDHYGLTARFKVLGATR